MTADPVSRKSTLHTIPVPPGWSPEQAWEQISRSQLLPTNYPEDEQRWVQVSVEGFTTDGIFVTGGRLVEVVDA